MPSLRSCWASYTRDSVDCYKAMMAIKPLDIIHVQKDGGGSFEGPNAIAVWRLSLIAQGLKLELATPPHIKPFRSNLKAAKDMTGLRTNDKQQQLERILIMLEQAKSQVVYLVEE